MIIKLAFRNILGAGLRTWLNVFILSIAYVSIIWVQGLNNGIMDQAKQAMVREEIAEGQLWHPNYDPFDPFSLEESYSKIPESLKKTNLDENYVPILIIPSVIYIEGRMKSILLKGINPSQKILKIPTLSLKNETELVPSLIGKRMAASCRIKEGDNVTLRWKDKNGTFDAIDITIVEIMDVLSPGIDSNQLWIPLEKMQSMIQSPESATIIVLNNKAVINDDIQWRHKTQYDLLIDIRKLVKTKSVGSSILYVLLLFLAVIAIFDTQVLSIFRRRKEIGTLMALGMTRLKVILLFTLEGTLHGLLALIVGFIYSLPLFIVTAKKGFPLPELSDEWGFAGLSNVLYPTYGMYIILGTVALVMIVVIIVSYYPTRKISKLKPTDALKGKIV